MRDTDFDAMARTLDAHEDYRVLRRYRRPERYHEASGDGTEVLRGVFIDTETTGFDAVAERVIELAIVPFEFSSDGRIYRLFDAFDELEDPGKPIPDVVVRLTGIDNAMVDGKRIDDDAVEAMLDGVAVVIAHNARFDRPFCENRWPVFETKAWGCSLEQVPWSDEGYESAKLEYLAYRNGFFYDGHRASIDCLAGIELLSRTLPGSGEPALKTLLDNARGRSARVWATNSPFETKDQLKNRGYRWNTGEDGRPKAWYIDVPEADRDAEIAWLHEHVFRRKVPIDCDAINAFNRFSARV